jgi:hypothetical protein
MYSYPRAQSLLDGKTIVSDCGFVCRPLGNIARKIPPESSGDHLCATTVVLIGQHGTHEKKSGDREDDQRLIGFIRSFIHSFIHSFKLLEFFESNV